MMVTKKLTSPHQHASFWKSKMIRLRGALYPLGQFAKPSPPKLSHLVEESDRFLGKVVIDKFSSIIGYRTNALCAIGQPEFICLL